MRISDWSSDVCSSDLQPDDQVDLGDSGADRRRQHQREQPLHFRRQRRPAQMQAEPRATRLEGKPEELHDAAGKQRPGQQVAGLRRSEEHTSELQSLMRISYAVFCLKKKNTNK